MSSYSTMEIMFYIIAGIVGLYLTFRIVAAAIFRSWWDSRIWFIKQLRTQDKPKKEGKKDGEN